MRLKLAPDAVLRVFENSWLASNPRARRHVELDASGLSALTRLATGTDEPEWAEALKSCRGWRRTRFSNADGLMADPSCVGPRAEETSGTSLLGVLKEARVLIAEDGKDYDEFLKPSTSVLDRAHLGTFHQAVGRYQLAELRTKEKWRWWHDQKFTPDGTELKPGLYRWVQGHFFDRYFTRETFEEKRVLDFGCGNGYYSGRFSALGAKVVGLDPSPELLEIAKRHHSGVEFVQPENEAAVVPTLEKMEAGSFDAVYLSDVLLFFFYDPKTGAQNAEAVGSLLKAFRRLLKKDGRLYIMEPDAAFWLSPWYGDAARPFTVVTEFRRRVYHVAPSIDHVITALGKAGFAVTELLHPEVAPFEAGMDARAQGFASQFPLWDFYVCRPV